MKRADEALALIATIGAVAVAAIGSTAVAKVSEGESVLMLLSGFIASGFTTVLFVSISDGIRKHSAEALDLCRKAVPAAALVGVILSPDMRMSFAFIGAAAATVGLLSIFLPERRRKERSASIRPR